MISIIIASVNKQQLDHVKANISETVGIPFEIITFDNLGGSRGLCEVYNEGVKSAHYDILCFMHEDVNLKTKNWGKIVIDNFVKDSKLGLIGLAGSSYKAIAPSGWFCNGGPQKINYINLLQRDKTNSTNTIHHNQNPRNEKISEVVAVDGVWFCTKKSIALEYPFDETIFKKFHCYDIDFSLSIQQEYKVAVTFEVLLEHFSVGNYDRIWVEETLKLYGKWNTKFPIDLEGLSRWEQKISEKHAFRFFLKQMKLAGFNKFERLNVIHQSGIYKKLGSGLYFKLCLEA